MVQSLRETTTLNNGVEMPWFGLGVFQAKPEEVVQAVSGALQFGYRSIDTAAIYGNEEGVGQGIRQSGIKREEIFLTTKVWNGDQGYDSALRAFEASRQRLGVDYIDLYLIHWPGKDKYKETWKALEKLYKEGQIRSIGVSNFQTHHLDNLLADAEVVPVLNQVEYHPRLTQEPLLAYCQQKGIQLEAWSPIMQGQILDNPVIVELAEKYGKTPAQIVLRWDLDTKVVTIPKSVHRNRIEENASIFDFALNAEDVAKIRSLNQDKRIGPNPDEFLF